jgi:hypothetical protein
MSEQHNPFEPTTGERIARIETLLEAIRDDLHDMKALEKRVSTLERWRAYLIGAGAVLGALLSWLIGGHSGK